MASSRSRLVSCFLPWLALSALAPAQTDLAGVLPASSWAYVELAGLDQQTAAFRDARVVGLVRQILGAEGMKSLEAMARRQGGRELARMQAGLAQLGVEPGQVRAVLAGGAALGIGRPVFMGENVLPSLALVAVLRDESAVNAFTTLADRLAQQVGTRAARTVAGATFTALALPFGGEVLYGVHRGLGFVSNSPGYVAECVAALAGQTPSLQQAAALARGRGQIAGKCLAALFVDTQQFAAALAPLLPYEAEGIGRALGITGAPDLFLATAHDGKNACDVVDLGLPGPTDGLLKALLRKPASHRAARWVKARSTALYATATLDTGAVEAAGERLLAALPERLAYGIEHQLHRELGGRHGEELQHVHAVLAALGNEVTLAFDMPQPLPPFVTFTGFVEVRDPATAEHMLRQIADSGKLGEVQFEEVAGAKVWSTRVPRIQNMSPTVALRDGWLVFSNFKSVVKRQLENGDLGDDSLAADPRFAAAVRSAPNAAFFATGRLQRAVQDYWGLAATAIRGGTAQLGLAPDEMPDAEEVCEAVDDVVVSATATDQGFTLRVQQPLGIGALLPAGASALDWLLTLVGAPSPTGEKKIY